MKKLFALILILTMAASFASCKSKETDTLKEDNSISDDDILAEEEMDSEILEDIVEKPDSQKDNKEDNKVQAETKPGGTVQTQQKPETATKPQELPQTGSGTVTETKPSEDSNKSVGNILLADFKAKAASASSALSMAEALVKNPVIKFQGAAMSVEEGFLTGFGNAEIKGFKEGAMFAPMIGTIPFVGYVFTLENPQSAGDFIATLKKNADKRWNICTEADEMIAGSAGNKVLFVMSPLTLEE